MGGGPPMKHFLVTIACVALISTSLPAATWHITSDGSGDAPTIQAGIDSAAANGDTLLLGDGFYTGPGNRNIVCLDKSVTIRSEAGDPHACIIDCEAGYIFDRRGFYFGPGVQPAIEGITITNGAAAGYDFPFNAGGGVLCVGSAPAFRNCRFEGNVNTRLGAGVCSSDASPTFVDCTFAGNTGNNGLGGAVYIEGESILGAPSFTHCVFFQNSNWGGGAVAVKKSNPLFDHCTFSENVAVDCGDAICLWQEATARLVNTIITFGGSREAVYCGENCDASLFCCNIFGNAGGDWAGCIEDQLGASCNFSLDPEFCGIVGSGNLYLQSDSRCAPGAHPQQCDYGLVGALPVNCSSVDVKKSSLGGIKALFENGE